MNSNNNVNKHAEALFQRIPELKAESASFYDVYNTIESTFVKQKTLFLCGNGGSAADCEHIAGELLKSFKMKRPHSEKMKESFEKNLGSSELLDQLQPGLRTVSLLSHPGLMSAYANDMDPLFCFAQQLYALGSEGDCLLGISTSGNSKNVYRCFMTARGMGIKTILLTGQNHGRCEEFADVIFHAPSMETYRIQEYHLPVYHTLCIMLEERFFGNGK